jgi:arylsulfatase A-like enzyme
MEPSEFRGRIGRYHWESEPHWPARPEPRAGAPNVIIVLLDDVGFAQLGCFGSDIETPTMDRLAAAGLRYSNFHTTALCSPTRACVLTGRNHHTCGMGRIIELATGFPGYDASPARSIGFLPQMLTPQGYAAWAMGKWHLTPEDETHLAAPRARWPLGRGFERFYGFINGGETHQFAPALVCDNHFVKPATRGSDAMPDGYHFTEDIIDRSIECITDLRHVDVHKPFFLYLSPGACHSPHQAPRDLIDNYRGHFDGGWDHWREQTLARQKRTGLLPEHTELSPRPDWVPAWEALSDAARRVYARYMEAFAGFLTHTDRELGRLVDFLERTGELDNTLLFVLSDNGASSEGGPLGSVNDVRAWNAIGQSVDEALARLDEIGGPRMHNNYPWGWTVAGNTPFRRWKRETHEGGVADPLIVHWPQGVTAASQRDDGFRRHYVHAIDIVPTIFDAVGMDPPSTIDGVEQHPIEGVSFFATFADPAAPDRHTTQYYEMFGCRAIYHDGWKAVTYHPIQDDTPGVDQVRWELYDLRSDPSEVHDLADQKPEKLDELVELWWREAERYHVLPIDNRPFSEFVLERPPSVAPRPRYIYRPWASVVPEAVAVNVKNRPHTIAAHIDVPTDGQVEGVILAQGSYLGGYAFYILDGCLRYAHNLSGTAVHVVASDRRLGAGRHTVELRYGCDPERPKLAQLVIDGAAVGEDEIPQFTWNRFSLTGAGLTCGYGLAPAVSDDYVAPFRFTGGLDQVVVEVAGEPVVDPIAEALDAIRSQ